MKKSNGRQRNWTRSMGKAWSVPLAASAGLVVLSMNSQADACSCALSNGIQNSLPENGAVGVPTDVVIWAQGADVELIDEAGDVVPSHLEFKRGDFCSGSQLLTPDAELRPSSTYTLRAVPGTDNTLYAGEVAELSFTTGEGALEGDAPEKPSARVAAFDASNYLNSCVYSKSQVCMQTSYEGLIDVHLTSNGSDVHYVGYPQTLANLELGEEEGETCILVQARDLAGRLSEATELCVDFSSAPVIGTGDGPLYLDCSDEQLDPYYVSSDEDPGVPDDVDEASAVPDDEDASSEGSGCSASSAAPGAQSPWTFGLMGGFVSLLFLVRKRRLDSPFGSRR